MTPPTDPDALAKAMIEASARRMAQADVDEQRSVTAYRTGRFQEYWEQQGREAEARVEALYAELADPDADPGDAGADSGNEPAAGVSEDGADSPPEPPEQGGTPEGGGLAPATGGDTQG